VGIGKNVLDIGLRIAGALGAGLQDLAADRLLKAEGETQRTGPGGKDKDTAEGNPVPEKPAEKDPKSLFWDPFTVVEQLGYKDKPSQVTYGTLRAIARRMPVVGAVVKTRIDQLASFCTPQEDRYTVGFRVKLRDSKRSPSKAERKWTEQMEQLMLRTGVTKHPRGRDSFETLVRKLAFDSLIFDQTCMEVVPDRLGRPCEWYAVDAGTIRLADQKSVRQDEDDTKNVKYVQVYDGLVISQYTQAQMAWGVRNPRTDIRLYGYGESELEQMISAITSLLWAWEYNQRFFCIRGSTLVTTREGQQLVEDLAGREFEAWDGRAWQKARAFETQRQPVARTVLWNGLSLESGPEHRVRVIPRESLDGTPEWRQQQELAQGDCVLVDTQVSDPPMDLLAFLVGKEYQTDRCTGRAFVPTKELVEDPEFWEMMGFALGDGYWPTLGARASPRWLRIFPHFEKDLPLFEKFLAVCTRHGIHAQQVQINKSMERRSDGGRGYPSIQIGHRAFIEWLNDLGFTGSTSGKRIAPVLWRQPAWVRAALMRGLFSADGCTVQHRTGYCTPTLCCVNDVLRQDVLRCLFSLGVAANDVGTGKSRKGTIAVQNVAQFVEVIGYLLPYKREGTPRSSGAKDRWDGLHPACSRRVASRLQEIGHGKFSASDWDLIRKAARGDCRLSRPRAVMYLRQVGQEIPEELFYYQIPVDYTEVTSESELMFDVEVFSEEHAFLANGMMVHNSQGTSAKGILNFKGAIPNAQLDQFRRHWYMMISGVENAWRTPVTNAEDLQWVNLQQNNRDMEYNAWMDFLLKVVCAFYAMDPSEINFKYGNVGQKGSLSEEDSAGKLTESRERGLRPLLRHFASLFNRYLIWPTNENFEFEFVGLDSLTRGESADLAGKLVKTVRTVDEIRAEDDLPPMPDGLGKLILDPTFFQAWQQQKQQEAQQAAGGGQPGQPGAPQPGGDGGPAPDGPAGPGGQGAPGAPEGQPGGEQPDFESLLAQYEQEPEPEETAAKSLSEGSLARRMIVDIEL